MSARFPHCDDLVLHAPGECRFCDHYPDRQAAREQDGVNFTGQTDPAKRACPSTARRPLATIERWAGNVAVAPEPFPRDAVAQAALGDALDRVILGHPAPDYPRAYAAQVFDELERQGYTITRRER